MHRLLIKWRRPIFSREEGTTLSTLRWGLEFALASWAWGWLVSLPGVGRILSMVRGGEAGGMGIWIDSST